MSRYARAFEGLRGGGCPRAYEGFRGGGGTRAYEGWGAAQADDGEDAATVFPGTWRGRARGTGPPPHTPHYPHNRTHSARATLVTHLVLCPTQADVLLAKPALHLLAHVVLLLLLLGGGGGEGATANSALEGRSTCTRL